MAIARSLALLLALAASAEAGAQAQAVPRRGSAELPPASGSWADSGLVVARGDRLTFQAGPARPMSLRLNAPPQPVYRARIGSLEFPISLNAPVAAPAAGPLQLEVQYPQSPQAPPSRRPHVVMTVVDDPRPSKAGAGIATDQPPQGTGGAPAGNQVAGTMTGNRHGESRRKPANHAAAIPARRGLAVAPLPRSATWMLIALAAAGVAAVVAAALALGRAAKAPTPGPGAPAVTIDPSLDAAEGGVAGDAIGPDGPEVRLRGALEPGEIRFAQGEPALIGKAGHG